MSPRPRAATPRRRLSAEESRARISAAAERKLAEVGPEGLRLADLAAELGISHPAILHHFGCREELVGAVLAQALSRFNERLAAALGSGGHPAALLDMIAEFVGAEGNARLLAWLVLSGRAPKPQARGSAKPIQRMIELAHEQRVRAYPDRDIEYEDTKFRSQLAALALLGDAIFGDLVRANSGDAPGTEASRDFRKRLAKLLRDRKS